MENVYASLINKALISHNYLLVFIQSQRAAIQFHIENALDAVGLTPGEIGGNKLAELRQAVCFALAICRARIGKQRKRRYSGCPKGHTGKYSGHMPNNRLAGIIIRACTILRGTVYAHNDETNN